jgi:hypothetical protein
VALTPLLQLQATLHLVRPGFQMALCLSLVVCAPACRREGSPPPAPTPAQPARATLAGVRGTVSVKRAAGDAWFPAGTGTPLYDDDKLRTGSGASAELRFPSGTVVGVSEDTLLGIAESHRPPGRGQADVTVLRGAVDATLDRPANQSLTVGTPAATVRAGREIVFQ